MKSLPLALAAAATAVLALAGCGPSHSSHAAEAQAGKSAAAQVTANPQFLAARALVKHCFAGTPVQQAHQVHLVFLAKATGKYGPEVVAARAKTRECLGISKADEKPFVNDAVTQAKYGKVLATHGGRVAYFGTTLPKIVIKYSNAPGVGNGTASIPGTTPTAAAS